jgi:uncharacterized membrane protein HdeD (DUF308 family)
MRTIRLVAALILVFTGALHVVLYFKAPHEPGSMGMLAFGILFAIAGLLLFTPKMFAVYLGLILPIIGMTMGIAKFGLKGMTYTMALIYLIDVVVIICCVYIIFGRKKSN